MRHKIYEAFALTLTRTLSRSRSWLARIINETHSYSEMRSSAGITNDRLLPHCIRWHLGSLFACWPLSEPCCYLLLCCPAPFGQRFIHVRLIRGGSLNEIFLFSLGWRMQICSSHLFYPIDLRMWAWARPTL